MGNPHPKNGFDKRPQDINRNGRPPREWTWATIFEEELDKVDGRSKKEIKHRMAKIMIKKGLKGDVHAFKEIANRMDGLPKQIVEADVNLHRLNIIRPNETPNPDPDETPIEATAIKPEDNVEKAGEGGGDVS